MSSFFLFCDQLPEGNPPASGSRILCHVLWEDHCGSCCPAFPPPIKTNTFSHVSLLDCISAHLAQTHPFFTKGNVGSTPDAEELSIDLLGWCFMDASAEALRLQHLYGPCFHFVRYSAASQKKRSKRKRWGLRWAARVRQCCTIMCDLSS